MPKRFLLLVSLIGALSVTTKAQQITARDYAKAHGWKGGDSPEITLALPHACTLSKQHPCIYYGGDIDPNDPQENGLDNWSGPPAPPNTIDDWTYTEVNVPVAHRVKIYAAFTNNLQLYGVIDPQTASWDFRIGISEGIGGTSIGSGTSTAVLTDTGRNAFGYEEYELLTRTPVSLPSGKVWFDVQPNCTNNNDPACNTDPVQGFESDTDGLNGINTKFTVTSRTGMGPTFFCTENFLCGDFGNWESWCNDVGQACGDGMSAGLLK